MKTFEDNLQDGDMEALQIDVVRVQSFFFPPDKVVAEVPYVQGVYLIEDVVRVELNRICTPCERDLYIPSEPSFKGVH